LNNQSRFLNGLGRREDALTTIDEAVRRILSALEQADYLPDAGVEGRAHAGRAAAEGNEHD
jgi:hypothetical protein